MTFSFAGGIKDVQKRKQSGISIPVTDGLFAYFDANNPNSYPGAGNVWRDLTSRKHVANITTSIVGYNNRYGGHLVMSSDGTNTPATATTNLSSTNTVTLMAWINPNAVQNAWAGIIMDRAGTFSGMQFDGNGGTKLAFMWNTLHYTFDTGITVPANKWSLVSIVVTPTTITPYLNGTAGNVLTSTLATQTFSQFRLGWDNGATRGFQGKYGAAMIYNRSLSAAEVSSMYDFFKTRYVVADNSLQLHYDLADSACYSGSGTTLNDLSGNGKTTTLTNGPVYTTDNGGCLTFDGVNDYLTSVSISNPNGQLTCELVMDYNNTGAYHNIFDNNSTRPMLWIDNNGKLEASFASSGNPSGLTSPLAYNNQKVVVTAVYNSGSAPGIQLYVNGSSIGTNSNLQPTWSNPSTFTLFNRSNSQTFNGKLYSLKFYNKALTAQEVSQNYAAIKQNFYPTEFPASISNLEVWLKADSGAYNSSKNTISSDNTSAFVWEDKSGNNRNVLNTNATYQPVLRTGANGINNLPALSFDGLNDKLIGTWSGYNTSKPYTIFNVVNYTTFGDGIIYTYSLNNFTGFEGDAVRFLNSGGRKLRLCSNAIVDTGDLSGPLPPSGTLLLCFQHSGVSGTTGTFTIRSNGQQIYQNTSVTRPATVVGSDFAIGAQHFPDGSSGSLFAGKICEHLYFSKILNNKEINMVEAYLNAKWSCFQIDNTPKAISGLKVWLDATDHETLLQSSGGAGARGDGDVVGVWLDKSGNNNNAESTLTNRPTLKPQIYNGKNTIRFDGINDFFTLPNFANLGTDDFTAFIVTKVNTPATFTGIFEQFSTGGSNRVVFFVGQGAQRYQYYHNNWIGSGASGGILGSSINSIFKAVSNGTTRSLSINNGTTLSAVLADCNTSGNKTYLGNTVYNEYLNGDICEVLFYDRALTQEEQDRIHTYLKTKWGTP